MIENEETDVLKELEKELLDNGYSLKVKEAVMKWYTKQ